MKQILHAFSVLKEKCRGCMSCMKTCPTKALRIKEGKAVVIEDLCIDCGECINVCPGGAISPLTDTWEDVKRFEYKVAIPSPTLFGQFPLDITPADIVEGLIEIGFDDVYVPSIEAEIINMAIRDYLDESKGPFPLISSSCPVIVRLIQVSYPSMVEQVIPIEPPREIAGKFVKENYPERLGIPADKVGAIYLSPCPAKVVSIKQPAEGVKSFLDIGIGISYIYNPLYSAIMKIKKEGLSYGERESPVKSRVGLGWSTRGGQCTSLKPSKYISVAELPNVIRIFDDIEKGKIRGLEFLECYSCAAGCIGGPLTVNDRFVSLSKVQKLIETMEEEEVREVKKEAGKRYKKGEYFIRQPLKARPIERGPMDFEEQVKRMKIKEELLGRLPGINCGLCGSPTCPTFPDDVANNDSRPEDCIFLSDERVKKLRKTYKVKAIKKKK